MNGPSQTLDRVTRSAGGRMLQFGRPGALPVIGELCVSRLSRSAHEFYNRADEREASLMSELRISNLRRRSLRRSLLACLSRR